MIPRSVLVIDGGVETETVLKAVLERRGATVHRARGNRVTEWCHGPRPDVVVIDLDHSSTEGADWPSTPQVLLSSERLTVGDEQARFLEKPFHYPELIRAVEDLLAQ